MENKLAKQYLLKIYMAVQVKKLHQELLLLLLKNQYHLAAQNFKVMLKLK